MNPEIERDLWRALAIRLATGMRAWGAEEDGIPEDLGAGPDGSRITPYADAQMAMRAAGHAGSAWQLLGNDETYPSGKRVFQCAVCGRLSTTPDKRCAPQGAGAIAWENAR